jgi:sigma-E factor negative regulatory protein RseB
VLGSLVLLVVLVVPGGEPSGRGGRDSAGGTGGARPDPVADPLARRLLDRAAAAPLSVAYSGTQFVSAWASGRSTSQILRVEHSPARGTTWRGPGRDGSPRSVRSAAAGSGPSILDAGAAGLLARHYSLTSAGSDPVAGRDARVVEAWRPGAESAADHPVARYWVDGETGLALRREVYDRRGRVVRASAFVDVTVHPAGDTGSAPGAGATADAPPGDGAWARTLDGAAVVRLRHHRWQCPRSLPGPLPLVDARRGGQDGDIVHLSYADGIASISVFQQRGQLDGERLDGYRQRPGGGHTVWVREGVPRRVVWSAGGTVFTVVADAPERTVDRAVDALHDGTAAGGGGTMDRLGRGLDRVASWFNPFG